MAKSNNAITKAEPVIESMLSINLEGDGNIKMEKVTVEDGWVTKRTEFVHDSPDIAIGKLNQHLRFLRLSGGKF